MPFRNTSDARKLEVPSCNNELKSAQLHSINKRTIEVLAGRADYTPPSTICRLITVLYVSFRPLTCPVRGMAIRLRAIFA